MGDRSPNPNRLASNLNSAPPARNRNRNPTAETTHARADRSATVELPASEPGPPPRRYARGDIATAPPGHRTNVASVTYGWLCTAGSRPRRFWRPPETRILNTGTASRLSLPLLQRRPPAPSARNCGFRTGFRLTSLYAAPVPAVLLRASQTPHFCGPPNGRTSSQSVYSATPDPWPSRPAS